VITRGAQAPLTMLGYKMAYHHTTETQYAEYLENEMRMLNPTAPYDIMWNEIRRDWLRDWQVT
jgi:hypothetical protein